MRYTDEQLNRIYDRSGGDCHLCGKRLSFKNYGKPGERAAWEVDHSIARARGGTDRLNNLYPACTGCNRSKVANCTRATRRTHGLGRSPLSRDCRANVRQENTIGGAVGGALAGAAVAGPGGALAGALLGGILGGGTKPR